MDRIIFRFYPIFVAVQTRMQERLNIYYFSYLVCRNHSYLNINFCLVLNKFNPIPKFIFKRKKVAPIALAFARLVAYAVVQTNIYLTFLAFWSEL